MRSLLAPSILLALLSACAGTPAHIEEPVPPPPPPPRALDAGVDAPPTLSIYEDEVAPEGAACSSTSECGEGAMCRGPAGCGASWACGEALACGEDRVAYCDCEGVTFYAQSGCAGRPYLHTGACESTALASIEFGLPRGDEPIVNEDRICQSNADCGRGEVCYGRSGCGVTLRCERVRGCAGPRATFCSCDGETFEASASCPGRAYVRRGACDGMLASAAPDAGTSTSAGGTAVASRPDGGTVVASARPDAGRPDAGVSVASAAPDAGARWTQTTLADGSRTCRTNRDCRGTEVCAGDSGCGETWTCRRQRDVARSGGSCNRDTQYFCDCRGESFTASMDCPGRLYAHRGSCAIDAYIELSGGTTH